VKSTRDETLGASSSFELGVETAIVRIRSRLTGSGQSGARISEISRMLFASDRAMISGASALRTCGAILETAVKESWPAAMAARSSGRLTPARAAEMRR
jgi:hypothetical protein